MYGFPTVPPARPFVFFGLILVYILVLIAGALLLPAYQTPISVIGFVVLLVVVFAVEWKATTPKQKD